MESLDKVKKELEQLKSERDQIIGRQKSLMERLNAEFGLSSRDCEVRKGARDLDRENRPPPK